MAIPYYLHIGKASDLKDKKERFLYRSFEMLPGILSWGSLITLTILAWQTPVLAAVFIICFDIYWLLRTVYFSLHLKAGYARMQIHTKIDWLAKVKKIPHWRQIYHLVVLPMYKEPLQVLQESFKSFLKNDFPKDRLIVVLAVEERAGQYAKDVAKTIEKEFGHSFFKFKIVFHPANIQGELPGKGSNETYALKKVKEEIIDPLGIPYQNIIVSSLDADTVLFPKYFSCLTYHYLKVADPAQTSFQPIPLYINNIWQASFFSRLFSFSSTFWHTMNQERPDRLITFSSHAMSFKALVEVGFKQTNIISEDSRIFWQCFLYYKGNYKTCPLYYPVSMDAVVAKGFFKTALHLYRQQRRWAWGMENIPYILFGFLKIKGIPLKKKIAFISELIEGHWSWATAPLIIFFFGWLPLLIGGPEFNQTLISYNLPQLTSKILTVSMIGIVASIYFSLNLLPPLKPPYGKGRYLAFALQWFLLPLVIIFFSALPALEAQTRWLFARYIDFWFTEKMR